MIELPRLQGSADDDAINGLIEACNRANDPRLTAHAAAAIVRFLMENHEYQAGNEWLSKVEPLVGDAEVSAAMVDKFYLGLVEGVDLERKQAQMKSGWLVALLIVAAIYIAWQVLL